MKYEYFYVEVMEKQKNEGKRYHRTGNYIKERDAWI
jgi:hypothetical protein